MWDDEYIIIRERMAVDTAVEMRGDWESSSKDVVERRGDGDNKRDEVWRGWRRIRMEEDIKGDKDSGSIYTVGQDQA